MKEHRKHLRLPFTSTVRIVSSNNIPLFATAININRGGIGLYASSVIHEGTSVKMDITFKDIRGKEMTEMVKGKIIFNYKWHWIYVIGIAFDQLLNHEETPYLFEYIENCEEMIHL